MVQGDGYLLRSILLPHLLYELKYTGDRLVVIKLEARGMFLMRFLNKLKYENCDL